jgi:hypothetical protein
MKYFILIIMFFSLSCESHKYPIDSIREHLITKYNVDPIWKINKIKISNNSKINFIPEYRNCNQVEVDFNIVLSEDCFENNDIKSTLDNNIVVKKIKNIFSIDSIRPEIYEKNNCLGKKWLENVFVKENQSMRDKIGTKYCYKNKSILNRDCSEYRIYLEEDYKKELNKLKKTFTFEMSMMTKHASKEKVVKKDSIIYCLDKEKVIFP